MADLKHELSPQTAAALAEVLRAAMPGFDRDGFVRDLDALLEPLSLSARASLLADRLVETLPHDFTDAAGVLHRALESPRLAGWMIWPTGEFVARAGIGSPELALPLLAALTPRWSAEFAIRPFVKRHPETTYAALSGWCDDPDEHVRRLVSEGTRPRLPWASRLRGLVADPSPNLPLLERLVDDPSPYVRRSVANHLNDIAKDHPDLAVELAGRWVSLGDGPAWVVRHGLRGLVKQGHPAALAVLGVDHGEPVRLVALTADRTALDVGEVAAFEAVLEPESDRPVEAVVDFRVHFVGVRGPRAPKVFKASRVRLLPGEQATVRWTHRFEHRSIRRLLPGPHLVEVQVNGVVLGGVTVELRDAPARTPAATTG